VRSVWRHRRRPRRRTRPGRRRG